MIFSGNNGKLFLEMSDSNVVLVLIVSVYAMYQRACRTECIIWSSGRDYLRYFGFQCHWHPNYILLKLYFICPYCLTQIGFKRKHLEKIALVIITVEKPGLTLLAEGNPWQSMNDSSCDYLSASYCWRKCIPFQRRTQLCITLEPWFLGLFGVWLAFMTIIILWENTPYSNVSKTGSQSRYEYPSFILVCMHM